MTIERLKDIFEIGGLSLGDFAMLVSSGAAMSE